MNFLRITSGASSSPIACPEPVADLLIFLSGSSRPMTRAPTVGSFVAGITNVSPYSELNRCAMSRASSRCCA